MTVDFTPGELTPWQDLSRGLKTLQGTVEGHSATLDQHKHILDMYHDMLATSNRQRVERDEQLTAVIEGIDAHLETVEASQQSYDTSIEALQGTAREMHETFQASINALDAKFDEYMQYVRNTSYTTIAQGTRITQLEVLVGQQRTMIETALRALHNWGESEELASDVSSLS